MKLSGFISTAQHVECHPVLDAAAQIVILSLGINPAWLAFIGTADLQQGGMADQRLQAVKSFLNTLFHQSITVTDFMIWGVVGLSL